MSEYIFELSTLPSVLLAGHSVCPPGWSLTDRALDETEIIVVYEGELRCVVGGEDCRLREGMACLVPPSTPVDQYAEGDGCRFFYAHIAAPLTPAEDEERRALIESALSPSPDLAGFFFLPPVTERDTRLLLATQMDPARYKSEIFTHFQRLLLERNRRTVHSTLVISLEIAGILTLLSQSHLEQTLPPPPAPEEREQNRLVQDALFFLNSNYTSPIRISALAARLQVSQQYLGRLFKAETGVTPVHYLNRLRIEKAKELMRSSKRNISEAALAVGFENIYYFSRLFKQHEGMSPSAYRAWLNSRSNQ